MNRISDEQFERLLSKSQYKLQRYASKLCRNKSEAEDLVQEATLKAYRHRDSCRDLLTFDRWMLAIVRNIYLRKQSRQQKRPLMVSLSTEFLIREVERVASDSIETPQDHLLNNSVDGHLIEALSKLSANSRTLFLSVVLDQSTYAGAAELYSIPIGTVKSRLNRICAQLRQHYEEAISQEPSLPVPV